jgi:hypothetical protein
VKKRKGEDLAWEQNNRDAILRDLFSSSSKEEEEEGGKDENKEVAKKKKERKKGQIGTKMLP